uniref:Transmembrane protein n=1 Tax=Chromera velia CCMP2878 TaxID=1169474 RepID=A0A0G4GI12_9ALVE|eukprot:Cvel_21975.t1-p1 / transcript=Cvel_21975.t1 / gene=Cvel_21975 / organism=Chromera_velia_CCMP2878 / gene_product=hypothetical protein / transcript_product=hypothetical protein / location=Cvel_scaffold2114:446-1213(+) / protein_length=256 / sequence_SO=supercontig / SO=protein_coding / is_pseudo=false
MKKRPTQFEQGSIQANSGGQHCIPSNNTSTNPEHEETVVATAMWEYFYAIVYPIVLTQAALLLATMNIIKDPEEGIESPSDSSSIREDFRLPLFTSVALAVLTCMTIVWTITQCLLRSTFRESKMISTRSAKARKTMRDNSMFWQKQLVPAVAVCTLLLGLSCIMSAVSIAYEGRSVFRDRGGDALAVSAEAFHCLSTMFGFTLCLLYILHVTLPSKPFGPMFSNSEAYTNQSSMGQGPMDAVMFKSQFQLQQRAQ